MVPKKNCNSNFFDTPNIQLVNWLTGQPNTDHYMDQKLKTRFQFYLAPRTDSHGFAQQPTGWRTAAEDSGGPESTLSRNAPPDSALLEQPSICPPPPPADSWSGPRVCAAWAGWVHILHCAWGECWQFDHHASESKAAGSLICWLLGLSDRHYSFPAHLLNLK